MPYEPDGPLPWIWRPASHHDRIIIRMPYAGGTNRAWLRRALGNIRPELEPGGRWYIARNHFRQLARAMEDRFPTVHIYLDFNANTKCDTRCRDAYYDECTCSCLGKNHKGASYIHDWHEVGTTTLIHYEGRRRTHYILGEPEPEPPDPERARNHEPPTQEHGFW